jgi:hypothetical protein
VQLADAAGARGAAGDPVVLRPCTVCGAPTPGDVCAFCKLRERASKTS